MNVFTVRVGKNTRRGNFQELYQQTVSVPDNITKRELYTYFRPRYAGFDVTVEDVEVLNLTDSISAPKPIPNPNPNRKKTGQLDIKAKLTEAEKDLLKHRNKCRNDLDKATEKLKDAIKERYSNLSYVSWLKVRDINDYEVFLELTIKSNEFFNVIKNGVEDELLIEECDPNSVLTDDIPC